MTLHMTDKLPTTSHGPYQHLIPSHCNSTFSKLDIPYCSTSLWFLKRKRHVNSCWLSPDNQGLCSHISAPPLNPISNTKAHTLLLLIPIILDNLCLKKHPIAFILRFHLNMRFILNIPNSSYQHHPSPKVRLTRSVLRRRPVKPLLRIIASSPSDIRINQEREFPLR